MATERGFQCHCLSFRYGQRHAVELAAAARVARAGRAASHQVVDVDLRAFGGSALTDDALAVPKDGASSSSSSSPSLSASVIPITYVPARNTVFLSFGLALAEVKGARDLFIGANAVDYSGYPDCRPEFLAAFEAMANLATRMGVEATTPDERIRVQAPIVSLSKADIIREGTRLGVDYGLTWSCYDPQAPTGVGGVDDARACGACDSCAIRKRGFVDAGVTDPTRYATHG